MASSADASAGNEGKGGIRFSEVDIDLALSSTGAFGWTFKKAQNDVRRRMYRLHKADELRKKREKERRKARERLQAQPVENHAVGFPSTQLNWKQEPQSEQERTRARFAVERAQCICPLSCLPMRWPVVAADGVVYEKAAISRWLAQKGLVSPVTGMPLKNALLIRHQTMTAVAKDVHENSQWSSSLMHGYTASLRASKKLGAAPVQTSGQNTGAAAANGEGGQAATCGKDGRVSQSTDGCLWDGGTTANLLLADTDAAKASLQHGILLSKRRHNVQQHQQQQQRCPISQPKREVAPLSTPPPPPADAVDSPNGPGRSRSPGQSNQRTPSRLRRASAPVGPRANSGNGEAGYAGNHGKGGLGGGGGSAVQGMRYSRAEIVDFSPRFWPKTPTLAKKTNSRSPRHGRKQVQAARSSSPATRMRAELTREHKRQVKQAARATQSGQRGPIDGYTIVGFGSGSEVSRAPGFVPTEISGEQLAAQAAAKQAAKVSQSGPHVQLPATPPCLWGRLTGDDDNAALTTSDEQLQKPELKPGEQEQKPGAGRVLDAAEARLLEEWHIANGHGERGAT